VTEELASIGPILLIGKFEVMKRQTYTKTSLLLSRMKVEAECESQQVIGFDLFHKTLLTDQNLPNSRRVQYGYHRTPNLKNPFRQVDRTGGIG
jgi:hypothetical protein